MAEAKQKTTLQQLYEIQTIETVHAITDAERVDLTVKLPDSDDRALTLPPGHYLVLKVVVRPTERRGLFGVVAPKV
jgi:hypothetical protein